MIRRGSVTHRVLAELAEVDRPVKAQELRRVTRLPAASLRGLLHELRYDNLTSVKFYLTDSPFGSDDVSWWKITETGRKVLEHVEEG